jgi:hypothetical protein
LRGRDGGVAAASRASHAEVAIAGAEVRAMNLQRDPLSEALSELAATSPEGSPELRSRLAEAFAHHHARRRLHQRVAMLAAVALCVAISVYWLRPRKDISRNKVAEPVAKAAQVPAPVAQALIRKEPAQQPPLIAKNAVKPHIEPKHVKKDRQQAVKPRPATVETGDFVALSTFDPAIPVGDSRVVRMDLPGSALQLIGLPIEGQLLDRRIVTDVLVGQDGMPYAVRLIQTRNVH